MTNKKLILTWVLLIVLTIIVAIISLYSLKNITEVIIIISSIKFLLIAFIFMELYKAHKFWKYITTFFVILEASVFLLFL